MMNFRTVFLLLCCASLLSACAPQPPKPSPGHLDKGVLPVLEENTDIPPPVQSAPYLPPPAPVAEPERYTLVVDRIPIKSLLFALARDAKRNIEIDPAIEGYVTINAIDQTLEQILERIARQVLDLRYDIKNNDIIIRKDLPYIQTYRVDYVNLQRSSESDVSISTQVVTSGSFDEGAGSGGQSNNNSETRISNVSKNRFWDTLTQNIQAILKTEKQVVESHQQEAQQNVEKTEVTADSKSKTIDDIQSSVIVNPESGIVTIRATRHQHEEIEDFLKNVLQSVQRQVLIEATIVEVKLSDQYQAGIDWQRISGNFSYIQSMIGANIADTPAYILRYTNPNSSLGNISATVKLLEQFGNAKVLSSPKIMALNNQTAILKVVDNRVFFRVNIEQTDATDNSPARTTYETEIHTVPEGVIMHITPQISQEGAVILNVRPTVSRIVDFAYDPNPTLEIPNKIPIVQVREIESILKVNSGNIAVLGGLMQDITSHDSDNVPVLSNLPVVGDLFRHRDDNFVKSELVIFLRPVVIKDASLNGDLKAYRRYLHDNRRTEPSAPTGLQLNPQNWNRYAR